MNLWYQLIFEPVRALSSLAVLLVLAIIAMSLCVWLWRYGFKWGNAAQNRHLKWAMPGFVFFFLGPWLFWIFYNIGSWLLGADSHSIYWIMSWWYIMEQSIVWVAGAAAGLWETMEYTYSRSSVILLMVWILLMGFLFLAYFSQWRFRLLFVPATLVIVWLTAHQAAPPTVFDDLLPSGYDAILIARQMDWTPPTSPQIPTGRAYILFLLVSLLLSIPVITAVKEVKRVVVVFLILIMAVVALWPLPHRSPAMPADGSQVGEFPVDSEEWYKNLVQAYESGNEAEISKWVSLITGILTDEGMITDHDVCHNYAHLFPEVCKK